MLTITATQTETIYFNHSYGNDLTTVELLHRQNGRRVDLKIWSRIPLSLAEIRDAIAKVTGESHWQWRRLNTFAEYCPF